MAMTGLVGYEGHLRRSSDHSGARRLVGLGLAVDGLSGWAPGHLGFISTLLGLSEAWGRDISHTLDIPLWAVMQQDRTVAGERVTF